jgi:hypothetical protein
VGLPASGGKQKMEKIENKISYDIRGAIFEARSQRRSEDGDGVMKGLRDGVKL